QTPEFDIANCRYLVSFGARFLEGWTSPTAYSRAYAEFRRSSSKARGKFVQIEPRMSLTGANADEWIAARAGSEGLVALAMAQVILREKLVAEIPPIPPGFSDFGRDGNLDRYAPELVASVTGVEPERIIRIAREFAAAGAPVRGGNEAPVRG